jgi:hypothetical protein
LKTEHANDTLCARGRLQALVASKQHRATPHSCPSQARVSGIVIKLNTAVEVSIFMTILRCIEDACL